jgi:hypothetical protein
MSFAEYADGLQLTWKHANYCCYYASMPIVIVIFLMIMQACQFYALHSVTASAAWLSN